MFNCVFSGRNVNCTLNSNKQTIIAPNLYAILDADIDECQLDTDGCQGGCNNTDGGFLCTCEEGLQLQADSVTCQGNMHYL